jgi:endonuclease/exonuclease/phosphatase family metal-dependent hydrolase
LRKFIRNTLLVVNALLALLLLIIYLAVHISPSTAWVFAFITLSYPFVLALNIAFILFWLLFRKWYFIISLLFILLGLNFFKRYFQVKFRKHEPIAVENTIKVLTYNVRLFNYYQWDKDTAAWSRIMEYIHDEDPDIVCFQEFITLPGTPHDLSSLKKTLAPLSYSHVYYTDNVPRKLNFGMATFSKYPIVRKKMIDFKESLNGAISSDIIIRNDTIRIFNCHLQSIRLRNDYNNLLDNLLFNYSDEKLDELKDLSVRMRQAYIQRADQVDTLAVYISSSPFPVIVCGDFNDTPVSYTYEKLTRNLKDAFIQSGSGIGNTFRGNFPYVRIDYVLYSEPFRSHHYHTERVNWSDHFPVITNFTMSEKADSANQRSLPTK